MSCLEDLISLEDLLTSGEVNAKKKKLHSRFMREVGQLASKYEHMYHKYILRNRKLKTIVSERERDIAIVQRSMSAFMPYILAYNVAQMSESVVGDDEGGINNGLGDGFALSGSEFIRSAIATART